MSYVNKTVSVNSDEKTFIKTFVQQLMQADSRITCDTDIDEQFSHSGYPTFTVNLGTNSRIVFKRSEGIFNVDASYYNVAVIINGTQTNVQLVYSSTATRFGVVTTRTWKFTVVANESAVYIAFGDYNTNIPDSAKFSVMSISDGEFSATAFAAGASSLGSTFYCTDNANKNLAVKFTDRLNYKVDDGSVEIIKNKALLNGKVKFFDFAGLYDCSNMPQFLQLEIDGVKYLTIGTNTLMPI